jgi:AcrR family transcriptional regulator
LQYDYIVNIILANNVGIVNIHFEFVMQKETELQPKKTDKRYHHGDLRNALLLAGTEILVEEGLGGLDLRKVARRAGVSHNAPYRHFADKEALLVAIAQTGFEELAERIRSSLDNAPENSLARLEAIGLAYINFALEKPAHLREMFSGLTIRRIEYPELYAISKQSFILLLGVLQDGQARSEIVAGILEDQAVTLLSLIHGLAMLLIEDQIPEKGGRAAAEQITLTTVQIFYNGLARR